MGSLKTFIRRYEVHKFLVLQLLLQIIAWIFSSLLSFSYIGMYATQEFLLTISLFLHTIFFILGVIIYIFLLFSKLYRQTTGRNLIQDRREYGMNYWKLRRFFSSADPSKLDESEYPITSWRHCNGVILGKKNGHLIYRESNAPGNIAIFSRPGEGKTTAQIIPTALRFNGSVFAIDIKGDIIHYTKSNRNIKIFAPEQPEISCSFDPFDGIETMTSSERRSFIENIASILVVNGTDDNGKYFTDGARNYFCGIVFYCLQQDISTAFPSIVTKILAGGDAISWVKTILQSNCQIAKEYLASYYGTNEKNVAGCYNALCTALRPFSSPTLVKLLGKSEHHITPQDLANKYDVYIEIPQDKINYYSPIMTMIVQNFLTSFMRLPDISSGKFVRPTIFLLDEFPQLNFNFESLSSALATLRSKKVTLFIAAQSISQLSRRYGDYGAREIIDNCAYISIMSAQDTHSQKYFSDMIGQKKVLKTATSYNSSSYSDQSKSSGTSVHEEWEPVIRPEALGNLNGKVLIIANGKHILADKTFVFEK